MRALDLLLLLALALVVAGVAMLFVPAAFIVAGLGLGGAWWLLDDPAPPAEDDELEGRP